MWLGNSQPCSPVKLAAFEEVQALPAAGSDADLMLFRQAANVNNVGMVKLPQGPPPAKAPNFLQRLGLPCCNLAHAEDHHVVGKKWVQVFDINTGTR